MAKHPTSKGGTSRIRFIMLDAEIPEGDLSQITTAIQNALKPVTVIQQRLPAQSATSDHHNKEIGAAVDEQISEIDEENVEISEVSRPSRESRVRKPTVPKVLDLDFKSDVSFESFATEHSYNSEPDRNLIVAAWFKEHRNIEVITASHVYTCYRAVKWQTGIGDFAWPLRKLKKEQLMSGAGRGEYAINHLGLDRVQKMKSE